MNYKTKVLFLFGILLFGIGLSYFLGETFMEGFDAKAATTVAASTTPAAATTAAASTTPAAATTAAATTPAAAAKPAAATTPAAVTKPAATTSSFSLPSFALPSFTLPSFASPSFASPSKKTYDNYNHYKDMTSTKYFGSTGTPINPLQEDDAEVSSTIPKPNSSTKNSAKNSASKDYGTQYYSTLPPGIPASQIMPGDEHLYILKSEIVPPVCPACPAFPSASLVNNKEPPPPCPPCGRCPEPSFECKKVPNYNAVNDGSLPMPVLNDFSSFGM